jgi:hypothetical protein
LAELSPRDSAILARLTAGKQSDSSWRLSRAIWRAGEVRLTEAEPLLCGLIGDEPMTDYCIAWSLGRIGQPQSLPTLVKIADSHGNNSNICQIAREAMRLVVSEKDREGLIASEIDNLPSELQTLLKAGDVEAFQTEFMEGLKSKYDPRLISSLYFIDNEITRQVVLNFLETVPFEPPFFRAVRRLFKAAELRRDAQVFGLFGYRVERHQSKFRVPSYSYQRYTKPTLGENPKHALGGQSRHYFRRRIWNTLRRLGELADPDFVPMAVGTLLPFKESDARVARVDSRYDWRERTYSHVYWDEFGTYWAFNHLLFANSSRFVEAKTSFRYVSGLQPGGKPPAENEAAFPELWKSEPRGLLHLLIDSQCHHVHEFAAKALRDCQEFCGELPLDVIKILLRSDYEVTIELAFEIARQRYDKNDPDIELVALLANCGLPAARTQAHQWIAERRSQFFADNDFTFAILTSKFEDTRKLGLDSASLIESNDENIKSLVARLIAFMQSADLEQAEIANDIGATLLHRTFERAVSTLGEEVLCDLLRSEITGVQTFAGSAVLGHATLANSPTERIMRAMLDATHPPVRAMGIKLISDLPKAALFTNIGMLAGLTCHELVDIRNEVRPLVKQLAAENRSFGIEMASELIRRLLIPGAPEGVPTHTSEVVREDLANCLRQVTDETTMQLLNARSLPAQRVGSLLLPNVAASSLKVIEIVKLANHGILSVREIAWGMYAGDIHRMRTTMSSAVRILDSDWEDSRQFGFEFLKSKVDERYLTPEVLISICDSVREDVQQFGRDMITRRFKSDDGPEYLTKLSEHPTTSMQLFATNVLVEYGSDNPQRIKELAPYFGSVLSRVNQSRTAKDRVLQFLADEAVEDLDSATTISEILARISATCAIGDRAKTIEGMVELHEAYPDIELPIALKQPEVR